MAENKHTPGPARYRRSHGGRLMAAKVECQIDPDNEDRTAYKVTGTRADVDAAVAALSAGNHRSCKFITSRLEGQMYGALGEIIRGASL